MISRVKAIHRRKTRKTVIQSNSTDVELRGREEANSTYHNSFSPVWLSDSKNMINALTGESDTHKENQEKGNSVSCTGK